MYSNKTIQIAIFIFVAMMVRPLYAGCSAFDFEKSKADIPIIVAGTVLSSEEITLSPAAEATKSDPYILDHEGKEVKVFSSNNIIKEHKFSFKITKTEKGYLKDQLAIDPLPKTLRLYYREDATSDASEPPSDLTVPASTVGS